MTDQRRKRPARPVHGQQYPIPSQIGYDFSQVSPKPDPWTPAPELQTQIQFDRHRQAQRTAYANTMAAHPSVESDARSRLSNAVLCDEYPGDEPSSQVSPTQLAMLVEKLVAKCVAQKILQSQYQPQLPLHDQLSQYVNETNSTVSQQARNPTSTPQESIDAQYQIMYLMRLMHELHEASTPPMQGTQQSPRGHSYGPIRGKNKSLLIAGNVGEHSNPKVHEYESIDADGSCTLMIGDVTVEGYDRAQHYRSKHETTNETPTQSQRNS